MGKRGSGPVKPAPTDASIEQQLRGAIDQWRYIARTGHRRIIRTMELMVMNHRQVFDYMSGEELLRQASYRQGMLYAFKMIAAMSQACLDENPEGAAIVAVQQSNQQDDEERDPYA